jgi:6,7-dimethyl-8-ribityllumazine synthase
MSSDARSPQRQAPVLFGAGMRVAIVCSRFNDLVTTKLLEAARDALRGASLRDDDVTVAWVPGAFELPLAAKAYAQTGSFDAVICLGCVIRGETTHYELVSGECASGVQRAQLDTGVPVMFGVLATEDLDQALARVHVGRECGEGAVEMVTLLRSLKDRTV